MLNGSLVTHRTTGTFPAIQRDADVLFGGGCSATTQRSLDDVGRDPTLRTGTKSRLCKTSIHSVPGCASESADLGEDRSAIKVIDTNVIAKVPLHLGFNNAIHLTSLSGQMPIVALPAGDGDPEVSPGAAGRSRFGRVPSTPDDNSAEEFMQRLGSTR